MRRAEQTDSWKSFSLSYGSSQLGSGSSLQLTLPSRSLKIVNLMFVKCQIRTFLCALWSICLSKKWLITFISYGSILKAAYSQNILCFLLHIQTCGQNHCPLSFKHRSVDRWVLGHLINNRRMINVVTEYLAEKPYIPQKKLLLWICCKCLAW